MAKLKLLLAAVALFALPACMKAQTVFHAGMLEKPNTWTKMNTFYGANQVLNEAVFAGADCGARINNAYAALPTDGGKIVVASSCSFSTPISFSTNGKFAILEGNGAASTILTYTPNTGTAITLNYGNDKAGGGTGLYAGQGLRDFTLTGPGNSTGSTGVKLGGSQGAHGTLLMGMKIQSFGTNLTFDSNTWLTTVFHSTIRDGGTNLVMPSGLAVYGENMRFVSTLFADSPTPFTNGVWVQAGEVTFTDCSFDQSQLRVGNGATSGAQVTVTSSHFENPNGGAAYDFITMDDNDGNLLRLTNPYFFQSKSSGAPAQFATINGGTFIANSIGMFTQAAITNFAVLANGANAYLYGLDDLSGAITGQTFGGSTTGDVMQFAGANPEGVGRNVVIGSSGPGGSRLDVKGNIRATQSQFVSTVDTGMTISSISRSSNIVTLTTSAAHNLLSGVAIEVRGVTDSSFDGNFTVTSTPATDQLRYSQTASNGTSSGGSVNVPPFVNVSTYVARSLVSRPATYLKDGTPQVPVHVVFDNQDALDGSGSITVTLSGNAAYADSSSYACTANDRTAGSALRVDITSGTQFTISGGGASDNVTWICVGAE
jgi:hypothetical protein